MFSHVVLFWTNPEIPNAAEDLLAGCQHYLEPIGGFLHYHAALMAPSSRDVVDQSYQVGLNIVFADRAAHDAYQIAPLHIEFVEKVFKKLCVSVKIYDFGT